MNSDDGDLLDRAIQATKVDWTARFQPTGFRVHFLPHVRALELGAHAPRPPGGPPAVDLGPPTSGQGAAVFDVFERRASHRRWVDAVPVRRADLSAVLKYAFGARSNDRAVRRYIPTSGNLMSASVAVVVNRAEDLDAGAWSYDGIGHALVPIRPGDLGPWLRTEALLQPEFADAPVVLFVVAHVARLRAKYGVRALRLAMLDAGIAAHAAIHVAEAIGWRQCPSAGLMDDAVAELLGIDGVDVVPLLAIAMGQAL